MTESKEHSKSLFIMQTSLSPEDYKRAECFFNNNETKNCSIYQQKRLLGKLQFFSEQNEETYSLFQKENSFNIEMPNTLSQKLIPIIIHYLYFKEVQALQFEEIINFLDLAIFFQIQDLQENILNFLKETVDTAKKAVFLRISLSPLMKRTDFILADSIKELFIICETFLLVNNHMKEYLFLFSHQYYSFYQDCNNIDNIESDLLNRLDLMEKYKINGKFMLKLLFLSKDRLCTNKNDKSKFDFKSYANGIVEKYVKLGEISNTSLIKLFAKLELNLNDFTLQLANERIVELENEIKNLKEK